MCPRVEKRMGNVEKLSIALPAEMAKMIQEAVASGEYATSSEVIREALRDWKHKRELRATAITELRRLWDEGVASGSAGELDVEELLQEARARSAKTA